MTYSKPKIQNSKLSLPRYDRYKDSGVEWLGEIPEHWEVRSLRGILKERGETNEGTKTDFILSVMKDRGVIPYTEKGNVGNKMSEDITTYKLVCPGDLVINKMNAIIGSLGISEYHGALSKVYFVMQTRYEYLNNRFYGYLFQIRDFQKSLCKISYGIMELRESINFNEFKNLPLPLPPKLEQDRIVAFLDQKTAEIDALIAKKQRQIEFLDEQKAILVNRAVTRGLNPNAKLKPSGIEWIGDIPEHWEVKKLRWLLRSSVKNGISPPISEKGRVPTLSIAAVKNGRVTFGENVKFTAIHKSESASYLLRDGDILALRGNGSRHLVATAGIVGADVPEGCIYPDLLIRIQPTILIAPHYLVMQLNGVLRDSINLTAKTSAGIWKVSGESLSAQQVLLPPFNEQKSILDYVGSVQEETDVCKSRIKREKEFLKNLRSTLIAHAVTGGIKV